MFRSIWYASAALLLLTLASGCKRSVPANVAADGTPKGGNGWKPQGTGERKSQLPGGRS